MMLLVVTLGGMGAWVWNTKNDLKEVEAQVEQAEKASLDAVAAKELQMKQSISAMEQQHQKDVTAIMEKHQQELDVLRDGERKRMAESFKEFGDILDGNKKTVEYIDLLEKKVKSGQSVSAAEAQKLATIATGLSYLQKQYEKPFQEFGELEAYLSKRADANVETPNMRNAFWKRMFSRNFREQEREFYRTEGERRGFQEASRRFDDAYGSAQKQMKSVSLDLQKSLGSIQQLIDEKKAPENLDSFFDEARKALTTHQKLLDFVPDAPPQTDGVKP